MSLTPSPSSTINAVGGAGGGYLALYASRNTIINGLVSADGQVGADATPGCAWEAAGGGSGGALFISTGNLGNSTGTLSAVGGGSGLDATGTAENTGGGGGGRIAIHCAPMGGFPFSPSLNVSSWPLKFLVRGGVTYPGRRGGAGTVYVSCGSKPGTLLMAGDPTMPTPQLSTLILNAPCTQLSELVAGNSTGGVFVGSATGANVTLQVGTLANASALVLGAGVRLGVCGTVSNSPTPSITASPTSSWRPLTRTQTAQGTPSVSPTASQLSAISVVTSGTPTPSTTPYCAPALYRSLPRTDLVGTLMGNAWYPGTSLPATSESACRQSCCDAPICDAYTFATTDLQNAIVQSQLPLAQCFLYTNVTALVPNSGYTSGALFSSYS